MPPRMTNSHMRFTRRARSFGQVAKTVGLWGRSVSKAGDLAESVQTWLAQPGPALLHVRVKPMELVTLPSPFVSLEAVVGWRSMPPGRCAARAPTSGRCSWRTSPDPFR
jgi:hypothetical protein